MYVHVYGTLLSLPLSQPSQVEDDFDLSYPQLFERVFVVGLKKDPTSKKLVTEVTYTFPPRPPAEVPIYMCILLHVYMYITLPLRKVWIEI